MRLLVCVLRCLIADRKQSCGGPWQDAQLRPTGGPAERPHQLVVPLSGAASSQAVTQSARRIRGSSLARLGSSGASSWQLLVE